LHYTPFLIWFNLFSDGSVFFTVLILTFQLKKRVHQLQLQANTDFLTGASSRSYFTHVCNYELAKAYRDKIPLCLMVIDLDNFKQVNDNFGHLKGDQVLIEVASKIKANLRQGDLFGRMGGDEFAILVHNTNETQAKNLIARIQLNLLDINARLKTNISFSIGVVTYFTETQTNFDHLFEIADNAMYSIKRNSKNATKFVYA
jgi:diguanylate cyclase (GGDEF)-like protein